MKSRVNRARIRLAEMLSITSGMDFGHDGDWQAIDAVAAAGQRLLRGDGE